MSRLQIREDYRDRKIRRKIKENSLRNPTHTNKSFYTLPEI